MNYSSNPFPCNKTFKLFLTYHLKLLCPQLSLIPHSLLVSGLHSPLIRTNYQHRPLLLLLLWIIISNSSSNVVPTTYVLRQRKLRWLGHVRRIADGRIPKEILYGELDAWQEVCRPSPAALQGCLKAVPESPGY